MDLIDFNNRRNLLNRFEILFLMYEVYCLMFPTRRRKWWVRPVNQSREEIGFYQTCIRQLKERDLEHFAKAVRMTASQYDLLLTLLKEKLTRRSWRRPIDPATRLVVTLMYLEHGCSFQCLAWSFKLGVSTVREIVYDTCQAIWDELHQIYLAPPNILDLKNISQRFYERTGLPHCLGAIDGKLINIVCPRRSGSLYFSYKKRFAIILLAACDSDYTFTYVDVGAYGSQSDGGVFNRSEFGRRILNNTLAVPIQKNLPNSEILFPHFFIADNAFPLRTNIMRPFPGQNLTADKAHFNKTLSKSRVRIEIAFGILTNRWRVLHSTISASPKNADKIVLATVVLHNFLMLQKDSSYFTDDYVDLQTAEISRANSLPSSGYPFHSRSSQQAFNLRNILKNYLYLNAI